MTPTSSSRIRLLLCGVVSLVLFGCIVAVWVLPRPTAGVVRHSPAATDAAAAGGDDPCDLIVGPARDYCHTSTPTPSAGAAPAAATAGGRELDDQAAWLLVFSTAAISSGIALASTVGRRGW
ncbi:hypothetical protein OHA27_38080 [Streptomyces sp. NBC_01619]|uniref:hypothetical protein n=1 Tax=Streptomyces sp. NBC_01619 TaxID=2975901 RepID=UPI00225A8777|nr:hypothetical protein [Streptomyces sp. NBC_01619]MCX4515929.1 hypothetical protein [Streptomyces sp. NBC_01619]